MRNPDLFLADAHAPPSEVSFQDGEPTPPLSECSAPCARVVEDRNSFRDRLAAQSGPGGGLQAPL